MVAELRLTVENTRPRVAATRLQKLKWELRSLFAPAPGILLRYQPAPTYSSAVIWAPAMCSVCAGWPEPRDGKVFWLRSETDLD